MKDDITVIQNTSDRG